MSNPRCDIHGYPEMTCRPCSRDEDDRLESLLAAADERVAELEKQVRCYAGDAAADARRAAAAEARVKELEAEVKRCKEIIEFERQGQRSMAETIREINELAHVSVAISRHQAGTETEALRSAECARGEANRMAEKLTEAKTIFGALTDSHPCRFDHHGTCQEHHGMLNDGRCIQVAIAFWLASWPTGAGEKGKRE